MNWKDAGKDWKGVDPEELYHKPTK